MEWHEIIVNGQAQSAQPIIDLSDENLTELLYDLFQPLSFVELFELYEATQKEPSMQAEVNWQKLFEKSNKTWTQRTEQLFMKMSQLPKEFIDWCFERKMECRDLMPINGLSDLKAFSALAVKFSQFSFTRNEGRMIIDLLVDLLLMKKSPEELLVVCDEQWLSSLEKIRNPKTLQKQESKENKWPKYAQEQRFRHGDRWQYKLNIQFKDSKDLEKKLKNLSEQVPQQ